MPNILSVPERSTLGRKMPMLPVRVSASLKMYCPPVAM
jgi:hypothetical protein